MLEIFDEIVLLLIDPEKNVIIESIKFKTISEGGGGQYRLYFNDDQLSEFLTVIGQSYVYFDV
jgi:hypothetical protein